MIKLRKLTSLLLIAAVLALFPKNVKYIDSWGPHGFSIDNSSKGGITLIYSVNEFATGQKSVNGEIKTTLQLPGVFLQNDAGSPDLPGSGRNIAIPKGAKASFRIIEMRTETFRNIEIAPAPVIPKDTDRQPLKYVENKAIFSLNAYYPSSPVMLSTPAKIRGLDVVTLGITPFQYNPVTKELIVYRDLKVEVNFEGGNGQFGEERLRNRYWDRI